MAHVITTDGVKKGLKLKYGHAIYPGGARKIKSGHAIDTDANGGKLARKFYSADAFGAYTGEFTVSQVTGTDGVLYNLYTLIKSGTLTLNDTAQAWICGGGGNGCTQATAKAGGGGGGGGYVNSGELSVGEYTVIIGSAAGNSSIGDAMIANCGKNASGVTGGDGGSGGGGSGYTASVANGGKGAGVSTYPFGITSLYAHCAGGGGGSRIEQTTNGRYYGNRPSAGGSNGAQAYGSTRIRDTAATTSYISGGSGGDRGGGKGGTATTGNAQSATFYGSGGGGCGTGIIGSTEYRGTAGSGYQGVAYILVPA